MKLISRFFKDWNIHVSMSPDEFRELLLSHHPNHPCFDGDVVRICNARICAGCFFGYPSAIITLLLFHPSGYSAILIALALAGFSQLRRVTTNRFIQNCFRIIAGIALGFGLGSGIWAIIEGQWTIIALLAIGGCAYILFKLNSMKKKMQQIC